MSEFERFIEEGLRLTSPHGLPAHMEGVIRTFKSASGYILEERRKGRPLTAREIDVLDAQLRILLYKFELGKSRVSLQIKDARTTYRFFDILTRARFNGALSMSAQDFAQVMLELGIKNMSDLRSVVRHIP